VRWAGVSGHRRRKAHARQAGLGRGSRAHVGAPGFVTHAHLRGACDRTIAHRPRHRLPVTLSIYVRIHEAWEDNAATRLGL
jgi:hypothetical protein